MYADDSSYVVSSRDRDRNQTKILRNLDELTLFLNDNRLVINPTKTSLLEMMIRQGLRDPGTPPRLKVQDEKGKDKWIVDSSHLRVLGGNLQANLTWESHLESGLKALLPGVRQQLGRLRFLGTLIPKRSRANMARGMILSRLNYLMPLWGGAATHKSEKCKL